MSAALGSLVVSLEANMAQFTSAMDQAGYMAEQSMKRVESAVEMGKKSLEYLGIGIGLIEIKNFISESIEAADSLYLMSQKIGISVEELSRYQLAARQSGVDINEFGKGIKNLSVFMEKHQEDLASLGVTSRDTDTAFKQLADVFQALPDGFQKTALAQEIFKKSGIEMIPLLNKGAEGLQEAADKSDLFAKKTALFAPIAHEFNDRLEELKIMSGGLANTVGLSLVPILNTVIDDFEESKKKTDNLTKSFDPLGEAGKAIVILFGNVAFVLRGIGTEIGGLAAQFAQISKGGLFDKTSREATAAIGDQMKKDAAAARAEFDAWEKKILGVKTGLASIKSAEVGGTTKTAEEIKALQATIDALLNKGGSSDVAQKFLDQMAATAAMDTTSSRYDKMTAKAEQFALVNIKGSQAQVDFLTKAEAIALNVKTYDDAAADVKQNTKEFDDLSKSIDKAFTSIDSLKKARTAENLTAAESLNWIGMTNDAREIAVIKWNAEQKAIEARDLASRINDADMRQQALDEIAASQKSVDAYIANVKKRQDADESWSTGVSASFENYLKSTTAAAQANKVFSDLFKGMEDALVNFVKTGKLDFKSLADSIITDLIRINIQNGIMKPLNTDLSGTPTESGGFFSSIGGLLSSFLPSFAVGTDYVPQDMVAQIHQGERIIPASQNNGSSVPNVVVQVVNQSGTAVTAKQQGGPAFNGTDWVISVVMDAANTNPGFRNAMGIGAH